MPTADVGLTPFHPLDNGGACVFYPSAIQAESVFVVSRETLLTIVLYKECTTDCNTNSFKAFR